MSSRGKLMLQLWLKSKKMDNQKQSSTGIGKYFYKFCLNCVFL